MPARKLLIVDDSAFSRRMLRRILEEGGFEVEEAGGGREALEKYNASKPDAVLLDIVMQESGGLEVLHKLKTLDPNARVIMATADVQEVTRRDALAGGAVEVINKPFRPQDVLATLGRILGRERMTLPPRYKEALTELINVAYGRAASSLSELTRQRITLEVPKLEVHFLGELQEALQPLYTGEVWSVHQVFTGGMSGHAILLVDEKSARTLAAQILGENSPDAQSFGAVQESLTEAGNIVLQAALGVCGELLRIQVAFAVPGLRIENLGAMLNSVVVEQDELQYALLVRTRFQILSKDIAGNMMVILGVTSFTKLVEAVDQWEKHGLRS